MSDEIDFLLSVCRPEIDGEDEVSGIDITVGDYTSAQCCNECRVCPTGTQRLLNERTLT